MLLQTLAAFSFSSPAELPLPLAGSGYLLRAWATEDGLPENSATAIVQTQDGYLWFGTFQGLVRFDGAEFRVFDPNNTPQMLSPAVVNLHLDTRGTLWVSTYAGLVLREGALWRTQRRQDGSEVGTVRTFTERANGDLLVTTFDGAVLQYSDGKLLEMPSPPGERGAGYLGGVDEDGNWWVVQNKFIGRWEADRWVSTISPPDLPADALGIAAARDGGVWLLLGTQLRKLKRGADVVRITLPESPGGVWSLSEDSQGNLWIASYNQGFYRVTAAGAMLHFGAVDGASDSGRCIFEDRERNLWLGTSGDGLLLLARQRFRNFGLVSGAKSVPVHSVSADPQGGIWAATFGKGLWHVGDADGVDSIAPALTNNWPYLQAVLADRTGRLLVSRMGEGLWLKDQTGMHPISSPETAGGNIIALFEDSRQQVWMSGAGGRVSRWDGTNLQAFGLSDGISRDAGTCFAEDRDGAIWTAGKSGVFRRSSGSAFTEVKDAAGSAIRSVICLKADADGSVWLGSSDRGLLRWKDGTLVVLGADAGFPVTAVQDIVEDNCGFYWMPSGGRIVRANMRELQALADRRMPRLTCQVFDASDGLARAEFTEGHQPIGTKDTRGRLWFATTRGVATIDPAALQLNGQVPPVHVEAFSFYRPVSQVDTATGRKHVLEMPSRVPGPYSGRVTVPAGSRRIEIGYSALSLTAPEKVRFQVKLEGVDEDWVDAQQRRTAFYYELQPRGYLFQVRAANNDGVWNHAGASLAFTVLPFFWQTWWFRLGTGLLLMVLGGAFAWSWSRKRIGRAVEREHLVHETQQLREELAHSSRVSTLGALSGSLAHELNQPLGIILSNAQAAQELLAQEPPDLTEVQAILSDIIKADRRAGDVIGRLRTLLKHGQVFFQSLPVNEVIKEVLHISQSDLIGRGVTVIHELAPELPPVSGDRVQLQQVILNLILNAADAMSANKPGTRMLHVRTMLCQDRVRVSVRDEGTGLPADVERLFQPFYTTKAHGLGMGLAICRSIAAAHHGRLWAEPHSERGAVFHFELPVAGSLDKP